MRVVRFGLVGALNTLVDFALYVVLVGFLPLLAANFVSTSCGMVTSFVLNRGFTFRSSGPLGRQVVLFLLVTGTGLWVIQPLVLFGLAAFGAVWAKLAAIGIGMVWNFALYNSFVFRREPAHRH
ncbi:sugar translocase [Lentzea sp. NBRC 105346]|uniref:GtrA family protein n=1 Tax=Lentzea sp. NBRC 105346 TaxID=3032205 RepID=UPI002556D22C|nr:GtrA family protein [Lentzea sp. NBRC 105346]GLZ30458.1 sugar translocase [Lentzea sp. NBRC 105346]